MKLLVITASLSVFFAMQAVYWIVVSRRRAREAVLADRLGGPDTLRGNEGPGILRDVDDQGWLAQLSIATRLLLAVETEKETKLVAELPHAVLLHGLEGFERIDASRIPPSGELIVGWEDRFERSFRYQAAPVS